VPTSEEEDAEVYLVVINTEEQYSIWPSRKGVPPGWRPAGKQGSKAECLKHIDEVWTDMRPASLRRATKKPAKK
jgi:MbtH protein